MIDNQRSIKSKQMLRKYLLLAFLFVMILWLSMFIINIWLLYDREGFNGGTLGDSFGIVNSLFSGLAFALLIYTALMQKEELELQRQELRDNREELRRSADAHRELVKLTLFQNEIMVDQQRFSSNVNIHKLNPEFDIESDQSFNNKIRITLIIKYLPLKLLLVRHRISKRTVLSESVDLYPYQKKMIEIPNDMQEVDITFKSLSDTPVFYTQRISKGENSWHAHTPLIQKEQGL